MAEVKRTSEQIADAGERIYVEKIQGEVEARHRGKMLVLDINTGDHEIDESGLEAARRLKARRPEAELYALRIGYSVVGRIGGRRPAVAS